MSPPLPGLYSLCGLRASTRIIANIRMCHHTLNTPAEVRLWIHFRGRSLRLQAGSLRVGGCSAR